MSKKKPRGRPFTKNDPRAAKGRGHGRPKKSVTWKKAETELREAIPRIMRMKKEAVAKLLKGNPTGVEMIAAKYIHEHVTEVVNRFIGKIPTVVTGEDGAPLVSIPKSDPLDNEIRKQTTELLLKLIDQTK